MPECFVWSFNPWTARCGWAGALEAPGPRLLPHQMPEAYQSCCHYRPYLPTCLSLISCLPHLLISPSALLCLSKSLCLCSLTAQPGGRSTAWWPGMRPLVNDPVWGTDLLGSPGWTHGPSQAYTHTGVYSAYTHAPKTPAVNRHPPKSASPTHLGAPGLCLRP